MNDIIKHTREHLLTELSGVQSMVKDRVSDVQKDLETMHNDLFSKMTLMESGNRDLEFKYEEMQRLFKEHSVSVSNIMSTEFSNFTKETQAMNSNVKTAIFNQNEKINEHLKDDDQWRLDLENKTHNILVEYKNALRNVKVYSS